MDSVSQILNWMRGDNKVFFTLLMVMSFGAVAEAKLYKCVEGGKTSFQSIPCHNSAVQKEIKPSGQFSKVHSDIAAEKEKNSLVGKRVYTVRGEVVCPSLYAYKSYIDAVNSKYEHASAYFHSGKCFYIRSATPARVVEHYIKTDIVMFSTGEMTAFGNARSIEVRK